MLWQEWCRWQDFLRKLGHCIKNHQFSLHKNDIITFNYFLNDNFIDFSKIPLNGKSADLTISTFYTTGELKELVALRLVIIIIIFYYLLLITMSVYFV